MAGYAILIYCEGNARLHWRARPACETRCGVCRETRSTRRATALSLSLSLLSSSHSFTLSCTPFSSGGHRKAAPIYRLHRVMAPAIWPNALGRLTRLDPSSSSRSLHLSSHPLAGRDKRSTTTLTRTAQCYLASHQRRSRSLRRHRARLAPPHPLPTHSQPSHFTTYSPPRNNQLPGFIRTGTGLTARKFDFRIPFSRSMAAIQGAQIHSLARRGS